MMLWLIGDAHSGEPQTALLVEGAKDGDLVEYYSPLFPKSKGRLIVYEVESNPKRMNLGFSFDPQGQLPGIVGFGSQGSMPATTESVGFWKTVFFSAQTTEFIDRAPGPVLLGGTEYPGEILRFQLGDNRVVHFEITPVLPAGGLARATLVEGDKETRLWELSAHTETATLQSDESQPVLRKGRVLVRYPSPAADSIDK